MKMSDSVTPVGTFGADPRIVDKHVMHIAQTSGADLLVEGALREAPPAARNLIGPPGDGCGEPPARRFGLRHRGTGGRCAYGRRSSGTVLRRRPVLACCEIWTAALPGRPVFAYDAVVGVT